MTAEAPSISPNISSSSLTSTSRTVSSLPSIGVGGGNLIATNKFTAASCSHTENDAVISFLATIAAPATRHVFLQPPPLLARGPLDLAKRTLDRFAAAVGEEQVEERKRLEKEIRGNKKKRRKRAAMRNGEEQQKEVLKIRRLHVDGFETGQAWQQARKIVDCALAQAERRVRELVEMGEVVDGVEEEENGIGFSEDGRDLQPTEKDEGKVLGLGKDGFEVRSSEEEDEDNETGDSDNKHVCDGDGMSLTDAKAHQCSDEDEAEIGNENFEVEEEKDNKDRDEDEEDPNAPASEFLQDVHGLNDGFFSIDEFNKTTQWLEDQDARGDPNADLASEDETLDWHADPMAAPQAKAGAKKASKKNKDNDGEMGFDPDRDDDGEGSEDEGPTFGNMDLFAPDGASDDGDGNMDNGNIVDDGLDLTANDVYYKDFFAPPSKKGKKGSTREKQADSSAPQPNKSDMERAMNDVRRDLFEDVLDRADSGDERSRRSTHERRQAKLAEEIRKLEAELVAKRAWTLAGEASAVQRPVNSLLEEDLDFEYASKPLPLMTAEVAESIEELIKRRIVAQQFDEVLKRRPLAASVEGVRRGLVEEVRDKKNEKSLAEIYEEEHAKRCDPDGHISKADEKLRREELEIESMWRDISGKLDALASWHYRPKPATPGLTVVSDVATVAMEDAQPTTAQGVGSAEYSMLAPQELYRPGADQDKESEGREFVVSKSGLPVAKAELSREDRAARRRRTKERIRKAGGLEAKVSAMGERARERKATVGQLKKGGVTIINRKGERVAMDGKQVMGVAKKAVTSGTMKL